MRRAEAPGARHLLVVDDEPMILEVARLSLELVGGWLVSSAGSGAEALQKAAENAPDAILMDVTMPGMDGPTTCHRLWADPQTSQIPVILLTANLLKAERQRWAALPVAGVLSKPFDPMRLPAAIQELLGWS